MPKVVILIPSRYSARRLPGKPLLKAKGIPLIAHVYKKAKQTKIGQVYVVTGDVKILKALKKFTNNCIITKNKHRTGTDRIYEGAKKLRLNNNDYVVNLQGDEPLISVKDINRLIKVIVRKKLKIGTLACKINDNKVKQKFNDKNIVKVKTYKKINKETFSAAKNFFRISKKNKNKNENCYQHIGIYIYKFEILKLFVSLKQTLREKKLKLEQLRALDNQIPINVVLAETKPMGIDTKSDFVKFKKILERNNF